MNLPFKMPRGRLRPRVVAAAALLYVLAATVLGCAVTLSYVPSPMPAGVVAQGEASVTNAAVTGHPAPARRQLHQMLGLFGPRPTQPCVGKGAAWNGTHCQVGGSGHGTECLRMPGTSMPTERISTSSVPTDRIAMPT